jgi:ketosteroid isomerase-like protein
MVSCELSQDTTAVKGEIHGLVKQFAEATQKDVNAMLAMYEQGPATVSIANGQIERGIEGIRKNADANLVGTLGKFKLDLGSIEVTPMGSGYALAVTPFVMTENSSAVFARQVKGVSTLVWKKTPEGWKVIHEHESHQP